MHISTNTCNLDLNKRFELLLTQDVIHLLPHVGCVFLFFLQNMPNPNVSNLLRSNSVYLVQCMLEPV